MILITFQIIFISVEIFVFYFTPQYSLIVIFILNIICSLINETTLQKYIMHHSYHWNKENIMEIIRYNRHEPRYLDQLASNIFEINYEYFPNSKNVNIAKVISFSLQEVTMFIGFDKKLELSCFYPYTFLFMSDTSPIVETICCIRVRKLHE